MLYEAFVRDTMARIERADARGPPRPGARAAHRAQADLQPPRPLPQAAGGAARGPLGEARPARRAARHRPRRGRRGAGLHPVRRDGPAARGPPDAGRDPAPVPARRHARAGARGDGRPLPGRPGDSGSPVFLLSLKAGGTGLNLTRADHVVHVDRWWNPAVEEQATDRAYRIGQTRPVQVHRLVTRGTIEEKVAELLAPQAGAGRRGAGPRRGGADRARATRSCATWSRCARGPERPADAPGACRP